MLKVFSAHILCAALVITSISSSYAQEAEDGKAAGIQLSNLRSKMIQVTGGTVVLDTLDIVPGSLVVRDGVGGERISDSCLELSSVTSRLTFMCPVPDSVHVLFRVFPYDLDAPLAFKRRESILREDSVYYNPYVYRPGEVGPEEFLDFGGLNYSGSFSRGISFGSNQDFVINSALDLRLSGEIGDDIEIVAALTDNNIPIQPDGNTQQIQDFDQVFIQIRKDPHKLTAGDYELLARQGYFLKLYRQLQGASYSGNFDFGNRPYELNSQVSFAIMKGQFTRNTFEGIENNQGPYRLVGNKGETLIVVIAGSERVFVDGERLRRGQELDYTMDYNSGEITFTPNFLITKDVRIVVEFEYTERAYLRTMIHTGHTFTYKRLEAFLEVYSEQDAKNQSLDQDLTVEERSYLQNAGDEASEELFPGITVVEFDPEKNLYKLVDSTVGGIFYDSVFVYSTNPDSARFQLRFSYLGEGMGNYRPAANAANERVYRWVAPVNGIKQGSYEPVIRLVPPEKIQMINGGARYSFDESTVLSAQVGLSNRDLNTFSPVDNEDNQGIAVFSTFERTDELGESKSYKLVSRAEYEYKSRNFTAPEPYRPVEFTRDWNEGLSGGLANEHLMNSSLSVLSTDAKVSYSFSTFQKTDIYKGYRHVGEALYNKDGWKLRGKADHLNTRQEDINTRFFRPVFDISKSFKGSMGWTVGAGGFQEVNTIRSLPSDSLDRRSFKNNNLSAYVRTDDSSGIQLSAVYKRRTDFAAAGTAFGKITTGNTLQLKGVSRKWDMHNLEWTFTYRKLNVNDSTLTSQEEDNTVLGRVNYGFRLNKNWLRFNGIYELGSGQERLREFTYIEVPSGEGVFRWIDQNKDGVRQVNEFVVSEFADSANYIRVLSNSNEFIRANQVTYNQVINISPRSVWFNEEGIKGFLARINIISSIQSTRKSRLGEGTKPFNPFAFNVSSPDVVSVNNILRNSFVFNQSDPVYSFSYTWQLNQNKVLLINGLDSRELREHNLSARWNITSSINTEVEQSIGQNLFDSELFDTDDFFVRSWKTQLKFSYLNRSRMRVSVLYRLNRKVNDEDAGGEEALENRIQSDFKYNIAGKSSLTASFTFALVDYEGQTGTTKSYTILEGLQTGNNFLWNLQFERRLASFIQLSLQYEGRKTGNARVVNTGRASLRANF